MFSHMRSAVTNRMILTAALALLFMLFTFNVQARTASEDGDIALLSKTANAFAVVVKDAMPAVVFVEVEKTIERRSTSFPLQGDPFGFFNDPFFEHFFGPQMPGRRAPKKFKEMGQGSGFIISKDGYILTNNHVVGDADVIKVKLADGREFKAKVVGTDPRSDVAVIKINGKNLPSLPLGNSDKLKVGEWVIAIGNPFGLTQTVTVGVVSAKGRSRIGLSDYEDFIQTDAAINPGNSGGPLVNIHGEAVGINTAIFSKSGGYMGIGFAIPINMAKAIEKQLITKGKVVRGWLGVVIQDIDEDLAKSFNLEKTEGALVSEVSPDSPADRGGIQQGDVITALNGKKVENVDDLRNRIALTSPGTRVSLDILRNGVHKRISLNIGEQPSGMTMGMAQHSILHKLGLTVQDLTKALADQFGYQEGQGVLVADVIPGTPAAQIGIRPGQLIEEVNRHRVHNMKEFQKAFSESKHTKRVLFRIRSGKFSRYVALSIE